MEKKSPVRGVGLLGRGGNSNIEHFTCHLTLKNLLVGVPNENQWLGGGNSNIFGNFTPKIGEMIPYLTSIFLKGV